MSQKRKVLFFIGRALISFIFLISGMKKIFNWEGCLENLIMTLCDWHIHLNGSAFIEWLMHAAPMLLTFALFFEIVGALLLLVGYCYRIGALFLLVFFMPVTIFQHPFWFQVGDQYQLEFQFFLTNLALIGGLLLLSLNPRFAFPSKQ